MEKDVDFMRRAIELAWKGRGFVKSNPLVGAVFVKDGEIVAEGFHGKFGGAHAEIEALRKVDGAKLSGAELYVTLEPCCFEGKTPACTESLKGLGLKRVVVGMEDPNPKVSGKGIEILRDAGIDVEVGVCEEDVRLLNQSFIKNMTGGVPYLIFKVATSLDGKTCCSDGSSKWISGVESRRLVHLMRAEADGIIVGAGTVVSDNPNLGVRDVNGDDPVRVVLDRRLRTDVGADVYRDGNVVVVRTEKADGDRVMAFEEAGIEMIVFEGEIDLIELLKELKERGLGNLLLESGAELAGSFFEEDLIDKYVFFVAPKLIGGGGKNAIGGNGVGNIADVIEFERMETNLVGSDIMIEALRRIY